MFQSKEHTGLNSPLRYLTASGTQLIRYKFWLSSTPELHINKISPVPATGQGCSLALFQLQTWGELESNDPACAECSYKPCIKKKERKKPNPAWVRGQSRRLATCCANSMGTFLCQHWRCSRRVMALGTRSPATPLCWDTDCYATSNELIGAHVLSNRPGL